MKELNKELSEGVTTFVNGYMRPRSYIKIDSKDCEILIYEAIKFYLEQFNVDITQYYIECLKLLNNSGFDIKIYNKGELM